MSPVFTAKKHKLRVVENVSQDLRHLSKLKFGNITLETVVEIIFDAHFLPFASKMNSADDPLENPLNTI
jgi:hypothetical protein